MAMSLAEIRLRNNPVLAGLLLGASNAGSSFVAKSLFPELPQALSSMQLGRMGDAALRRYNLRRAPGAPTKRLEISWEGSTYTLDQDAIEVLIPREVMREANEAAKLNVGLHLQVSEIAMTTARSVLDLGLEIDAAGLATTAGTYASGHVLALSGTTKWSASTGTPVTDVRAAAEVIRQKTGRRPNKLTLSATAMAAVEGNPEVRGYLGANHMGPPTMDQLKAIFKVAEIAVGDAIWKDGTGTAEDVWGNNAVLAYVPPISASGAMSLAEPAFGFLSVMEGHPFTETPYFDNGRKSWVYGATFERRPNVATSEAGFLFQNPA